MSKRVPIGIMVIALLMIVVVIRYLVIIDTPLLSNISFSDKEYQLSIDTYYDETNDMYILFIPSYSSAENIKINKSDFLGIDFYDETTRYGNDLSSVPLNEPVTMELNNFNNTEEYDFMLMQSSNITTVYIETESLSMDYVNAIGRIKKMLLFLLLIAMGW